MALLIGSMLYMVQDISESFHLIRDELARWSDILAVHYQEFLLYK